MEEPFGLPCNLTLIEQYSTCTQHAPLTYLSHTGTGSCTVQEPRMHVRTQKLQRTNIIVSLFQRSNECVYLENTGAGAHGIHVADFL